MENKNPKPFNCETCKFWRCYDAGNMRGVCHVFPPGVSYEIKNYQGRTSYLYPSLGRSTGRPLTEGSNWCGQHEYAEREVNDERSSNPNRLDEDATSIYDRYISISEIDNLDM